MPVSRIASTQGIMHPEELALLQRVFDRACRSNGHAPSSPAAEDTAVRLIVLFRSGVMDEEKLFAALVESRARSSAA